VSAKRVSQRELQVAWMPRSFLSGGNPLQAFEGVRVLADEQH
jgi:hypothetical protein